MNKNNIETPYFTDFISFHSGKIHTRMRAIFDKQFKQLKLDITTEQSVLLLELYSQNGQYQKQLADKLNKDKANITRLVDILEKRQLISRQSDSSDRRKYKLFITNDGVDVVNKILPMLDFNMYCLRKVLSSDDEILYRNILEKLNIFADKLEQSLKKKNRFIKIIIFFIFLFCGFQGSSIAQDVQHEEKAKAPLQKYEDIFAPVELSIEKGKAIVPAHTPDILEEQTPPGTKFDENSFDKAKIIKELEEFAKSQKKHEIEKIDIKKEIAQNLKVDLCPVTLEDCINLALEKNFDIKIGESNVSNRYWLLKNAQAQFLPDYIYNYSRTHYSGQYLVGWILPDFINETAVIHTHRLEWKPFDGGRKFFELKARRNFYKSEQNALNFTKDEVVLNTSTAYYKLLGLKMGIEVLHRSLKENQAQLILTQELYRAGVGTKFDVLRAQAEVANAQRQLIQSYNEFRLAEASLSNILGIEVSVALIPVEEEITEYKLVNEDVSVDDMYNTAVQARPDLIALKFKISGLESSRKKIYGDFLPDLTFFASRDIVGTTSLPSKANDTLAMVINWKLGNKFGADTYTNLKAADAEISAQKLSLINQQRQIKQDIISAYETSLAATARVQAASARVKATAETLRLSFLRYDTGVGIFIDVIQAQTAYTDARIELLRAKIDYNTAQIQLLFNMGVISAHGVLEGYKLKK